MKLTEDMKVLMSEQLGIVATLGEGNLPNIGPKRTARLYNEEYIIWNENTGKHTMKNIENGNKVAIMYVNWGRNKGYRFIGTPKVVTEGAEYDACVEYAEANKMNKPLAAVVVKIEEVYSLSPKNAGELILK